MQRPYYKREAGCPHPPGQGPRRMLTENQIVNLGRKYNAGYALIPHGKSIYLEIIYTNAQYHVVNLGKN